MKPASQMVAEILATGISESLLADRCGVKQPTINRIKNGSATSYETGKAIETVYLEVCQPNPTEAA